MKKNPLIHTLIHLKGNPRACVYTEPLWGIPANLFGPYVSVYMLALGVSDAQIGIIASINIISQMMIHIIFHAVYEKKSKKV